MKLFFVGSFAIFFNYTWAQRDDFKNIDFQAADSIASHYTGYDLTNLPELSYKLSGPLTTDVEKFRAIYTWVSSNITNDVGDYQVNKKKREKFHDRPEALREWNDEFRKRIFDKLRREKKTVCTGYAWLIAELSGMADINVKIIDGYGRTAAVHPGDRPIPNHSWNAVELDNQWYLCDATWSSGGISLKQNTFIADYNDGYFLADPDLFVLNHYPLDTAWLLTDQKISLEDFINGPLVYKHAFTHRIRPVQPSEMNIRLVKNESVEFVFEMGQEEVVDKISIETSRGSYVKTLNPPLERAGRFYSFSFQPDMKGRFDLHVKVGDEYVISYSVDVRRK